VYVTDPLDLLCTEPPIPVTQPDISDVTVTAPSTAPPHVLFV
jgi:hypothetical protein